MSIKKTRVIIDDTKLKKIMNEIKKLNSSFTVIGLFSNEHEESENNLTVADIGFFNEYGTKDIPERPFIRNWFDSNLSKIKKEAEKLFKRVIDGKLSPEKALSILGEWAKGEIQKSITNLKTPVNAPSTISKKGSTNPLIDTGIMRSSIRHEEFINSPLPQGNSI